jgi:pimeloyl-ACP methyl ester carboxylesterase
MTPPFALHYNLVCAESAEPAAWMLVFHGIFGSGSNWRTFARRLVGRRPRWGAVLVDLRMHGRSQGAPPPHTIAAAAGDVRALAGDLSAAGRAPRALLAHSFGGKVALAARAGGLPGLEQTWIVDASPGRRLSGEGLRPQVVRVLELLEALPPRFSDRAAFVDDLTRRGLSTGIARWLAMNLEPRDDGYALRLDLPAVRALLEDYARTDLWDAVVDPAAPGEVHFVVAGRSDAIDPAARARLDAIASESPERVCVHDLPRSGHWVHVDALDALVELVAERLPAAP